MICTYCYHLGCKGIKRKSSAFIALEVILRQASKRINWLKTERCPTENFMGLNASYESKHTFLSCSRIVSVERSLP